MLRVTKATKFESSSLQGYVYADYAVLKKVFGKPGEGDGYKVDAEWELKFSDGVYATIYNYKDGKNYNGARGTPKTQITEWHVGGSSARAVRNVEDMLEMYYARQEAMTA